MAFINQKTRKKTIFNKNVKFYLWANRKDFYEKKGFIHIDIYLDGKNVKTLHLPHNASNKVWLEQFYECWCYNKAFRKKIIDDSSYYTKRPALPSYTIFQKENKESRLKEMIKEIETEKDRLKVHEKLKTIKSGRDHFSTLTKRELE